MPGNPQLTDDFVRLAEMTLRLHAFIAHGRGESPEADALRDEMDGPWYRLSEVETELADGLSADLYSLSNDELPPPDAGDTVIAEVELRAAWGAGEWVRVLHLLRYQPQFLTRDQVAFMRAYCWAQLGCFEVALAFQRHACSLAPENVEYRVMLGNLAAQAGSSSVADVISDIERAAGIANPSQRVLLAAALFAVADGLEEPQALDIEERVVRLLEETLAKHGDLQTLTASDAARSWVTLGICYADLKDAGRAEQAFRAALRLQPMNRQAQRLLREVTTDSSQTRPIPRTARMNLRGSGFHFEYAFRGNDPSPADLVPLLK